MLKALSYLIFSCCLVTNAQHCRLPSGEDLIISQAERERFNVSDYGKPTKIHGLLYYQHLCTKAFHYLLKGPLLHCLLKSVTGDIAPLRVVVVGVGDGNEVIEFANQRIEVLAIEPMPHYVSSLRNRVSQATNLQKFVRVVQAAAGAAESTADVRYQGKTVSTRVLRLDDLLPTWRSRVDVLSIDVHGWEADVIQGTRSLLRTGTIKQLWIELAAPCINQAQKLDMLKEVSRTHIIFDFTWWGQPHTSRDFRPWFRNSHMHGNFSDYYWSYRPDDFGGYLRHMCSVSRERFFWFQTDLVALHRKYITETDLVVLERMGEFCRKGMPRYCRLKQLVQAVAYGNLVQRERAGIFGHIT